MTLNIGPQHPSTHGVLRLVAQIEGERIKSIQPVIGYMHRGYEKLTEVRTFPQVTTLINRIDWLGSFANEVPFVLAAEKLMEIEAQLESIDTKNRKLVAGLEDDLSLEKRYESRLQRLAEGEQDQVRAEVVEEIEKIRARRQAKLNRGWSAVEPSAAVVMELIGAKEVSSVANIRTILSRARKKIRRHFAERCHELA